MNNIQSTVGIAVASVVLCALAGCGQAGPSESDVRKALIAVTGEANSMRGTFEHVKLVSCQEAAGNAWRCEMSNPPMSGRFAKTDAGWSYVGN